MDIRETMRRVMTPVSEGANEPLVWSLARANSLPASNVEIGWTDDGGVVVTVELSKATEEKFTARFKRALRKQVPKLKRINIKNPQPSSSSSSSSSW